MIYSRSSEYAIRAFVQLARAQPGQFVMAKDVAASTDIPAHFLAKILQQLAKKGYLRSSKGPTGGFALKKPASEISLLDVIAAVDGIDDYQRCLGGLTECNDQSPCGLHDSWKHMRSAIIRYLEDQTIASVSQSMEQKQKSLAKQRKRKSPAKRG